MKLKILLSTKQVICGSYPTVTPKGSENNNEKIRARKIISHIVRGFKSRYQKTGTMDFFETVIIRLNKPVFWIFSACTRWGFSPTRFELHPSIARDIDPRSRSSPLLYASRPASVVSPVMPRITDFGTWFCFNFLSRYHFFH